MKVQKKDIEEPKKLSGWAITGIVLLCVVGVFFLFIAGIVIFAIASVFSTPSISVSGDVAKISIIGAITADSSPNFFGTDTTASSKRIVGQIEQAKNDRKVKAVIFEINSPGGSGVASDEIAAAIRSLDKPTVAYIREVGASGAYWVASSTDHIFANKFSTVGSIGVIASYLDFSEFIDKYNVTYQRFVAGDNKDFGSPFREPTARERQRFQSQLDELHTLFIQEVAIGRNLDESYVRSLADGFFFTGASAVDAKLVDALGGYDESVRYIEEKLGMKVKVVEYTRPRGLFESLSGYSREALYQLGIGIGHGLSPKIDNSMVIKT
jgi:protease IV